MPDEHSRTNPLVALPWIVRLRYAMAVGQWLTCLAASRPPGIGLPFGWLAISPALVALSNLWLARGVGKDVGAASGSTLIDCGFVPDTFCLTATLLLSGGPSNPFSLLYLVHNTLATSSLTRRQTWALAPWHAFALGCCFGIPHRLKRWRCIRMAVAPPCTWSEYGPRSRLPPPSSPCSQDGSPSNSVSGNRFSCRCERNWPRKNGWPHW